MNEKDIFATNLQFLMEEHNITRNDLCRDLGFNYTTLADWIKARKFPRMDKVTKIAKYFNVQVSDLIEDKSKESPDYNTIRMADCQMYIIPLSDKDYCIVMALAKQLSERSI